MKNKSNNRYFKEIFVKILCLSLCAAFCLLAGCKDSQKNNVKSADSLSASSLQDKQQNNAASSCVEENSIEANLSGTANDISSTATTSGSESVVSSENNFQKPVESSTVSASSSELVSSSVSSAASGTIPSDLEITRIDHTRTYISEPSETEEQQFAIIKARVVEGLSIEYLPAPQKIEKFVNEPKNLYATAIYSKSDVLDMIANNEIAGCTPEFPNGLAGTMIQTKNFVNKPKWWDVGSEDLDSCMFAMCFPTAYEYKQKNGDAGVGQQDHYITALDIGNDLCRVYFACQTGLPDELIGNPECYRD